MEKGIILNGTSSIAIAKQDDLIYRLQPIETIVPIVIQNLKGGYKQSFELTDYLDSDYRVVGATVDFPEDDNTADFEGGELGGGSNTYVIFRTVKNDVVTATMYQNIDEDGTKIDMFCLNRTSTLVIVPTRDLNSITLYCQPIILEKQIVLA